MILKKVKYQERTGFLLIVSIIIVSQFSSAQIQQDAANSIQNAQEKLIEAIILLEESSEKKLEINDLVLKADSARNLIKEANDNYLEGEYELALQKSSSAIEQLDDLIEEIIEVLGLKKQQSRILFSLLGTTVALLSIGLVIIFLRKIYPWYKSKQLEEYSKLIIIYDEENKEVKHDR